MSYQIRLSTCSGLRQRAALAMALCGALCLTPQAVAKTAIEEMVVVANHLPTPSYLVGSAFSVLDTEAFAERIHFDPSALFRNLPSLNVSQTGGFGGLTEIRLRGSESNHTLVLIDGIEANDPANGAAFNLAQLAGTSIERIELLRGPQSARYGAEAIGGVIAIYTRPRIAAAQAIEQSLDLGVETGSHGFHLGQLRAQMQQPVGAAQWDNRFSATRALTNGSNTSPFGSESDGYRNRSWSADSSLYWAQGGELGISVRQTHSSSDGDPQDFAFPAGPTQGLVIDGDENNTARQRLVALHAGAKTGAWEHDLRLSQNASQTRFRKDGLYNSGLQGRLNKVDLSSARNFSSGHLTHALALGLQYEQRRFRNFSATLAGANHQASDRQHSQFAEYLVKGATRSLSISARHDNNERFANLTTWRVTATQALPRRLRLHGSWGEGSANPTFFELFGFIPDSFAGNPGLKPEYSKGWDMGMGGSHVDDRYRWDLTYFRSRLHDEIITAFGPAPNYLSRPENLVGASKRTGWELSADADVSQQLSVSAHFTWLDSTDANGQREVRRPGQSGAVNAHLAFAGGRGKASLAWVYNGRMQDNEFIYATPATRAEIKAVNLVNVGMSFALSDTATVFLRGHNLLDKEYEQVLGYRAPGITGSMGVIVSLR